MGQVISMGLTYCCFSSGASLCNSCFGTTAPGTTGRKRAVLLLSIAIATALWFQYSVGPAIVTADGWMWNLYSAIPGTGKIIRHAWYDSCSKYDQEGSNPNQHLMAQCAGNAGVYRPTFLATLFFLANAIATRIQPSLNREAWPAKYCLFFFAILATMFISSDPFFSGFYVWLARFGAAIFVVLQQIILIDVAYNWNDDWVERANEADRLSYGSGSGWLQAIVGTAVFFYATSLIGIGFLYHWFDDCPENTWVITLTLISILAMTGMQLASDTEGSILTSSVMSLYVTYLAMTIVSKNPSGRCNPQLGHDDVWGIVVGLLLTTISLAWTGWSWSAQGRLQVDSIQSAKPIHPSLATTTTTTNTTTTDDDINLDVPFLDADDQPTSGLVTETNNNSSISASDDHRMLQNVWKLNIVMALVSCYVAMILTGWGTIEEVDLETHNAANPTVGRVNMAILGISQWLAIGLYIWTLLAPKLFPDRDFS